LPNSDRPTRPASRTLNPRCSPGRACDASSPRGTQGKSSASDVRRGIFGRRAVVLRPQLIFYALVGSCGRNTKYNARSRNSQRRLPVAEMEPGIVGLKHGLRQIAARATLGAPTHYLVSPIAWF
jgi:hypothetical protein